MLKIPAPDVSNIFLCLYSGIINKTIMFDVLGYLNYLSLT